MLGKDILCVAAAYLLGGICFGYYIVRFRCHTDIREFGSGGVGARNVGRLLGKPGFVITLLGDSMKGLLAVLVVRWSHCSPPAISIALIAVIAGHIWPLPLQFRGGRGIATAIGAYLAYDYRLALLLLGLTAVLMVFRRGFILSGLAAFLLLPCIAPVLGYPGHAVMAIAACSVIIIYAHRERIRKVFTEALPTKEA